MNNSNEKIKSPNPSRVAGDGLRRIDINCDMGEGMANDAVIMPFISSANIACGYHAGDEELMQKTIELAADNGVALGAHPSFFDKKNFGRTEIDLSAAEIYELIIQQLTTINIVIKRNHLRLHHVKPHGALYNMSAKDPLIANAIARAVRDFDKRLVLFGLSGSHSVEESAAIGLKTAAEAFADRKYQDDGSLVPRSQSNALIEDVEQSVLQVLQMIREKTVTSVNGKSVPVMADTICIHGDGQYAAEFARKIFQTLKENNIELKPV